MMETSKRPPFWKRKYLISKKMQLKYVLVVVIAFAIVIVLVLWHVHNMIKTLMPSVEMKEMVQEIVKAEFLLLLKIFSMMLVLAVIMIFLTFRIAGPLFRIEKEIREMIETKNYDKEIKIRKGDEVGEIVGLLNKLISQIKKGE